MNPELRDVPKHMLQLGLSSLAHSLYMALFTHFFSSSSEIVCVLNAAHAAEILIKARIAQEHPLLIFEDLPRPTQTTSPLLDYVDLFEKGRTLQYFELPSRLWATTGIRLEDEGLFQRFGRLRNCIQHFAVPGQYDLTHETIAFVFGIIDPFINKCWSLYALDYNEDEDPHEYTVAPLIRHKIPFLVPPVAARLVREELDDPENGPLPKSYRETMLARIADAETTAEKEE